MRSVKIILPSMAMAVLLAGCAPPPPQRVVYAEPRPAPVYVEPGYRAPVYVPPSEEPVPVYGGPPVYGNRSDLNVTVLRTGDDRREYRRGPGYPGRPGYYGDRRPGGGGDRRPGEGGERGPGRRMCGQPGQPACQR
jgi:hypothetical protein